MKYTYESDQDQSPLLTTEDLPFIALELGKLKMELGCFLEKLKLSMSFVFS